ncbi:RiPP maturation radical SAM C-methyltransferase [Sinorhizobium meliloti]|uniref:RiPP maturation radical SAM C-methyltransferase n=1 Tax=Rhizobium meliloti TaxID=382 RepID=UPI000FD50FDD|nr:RiPP maturation radical SAM C-methyltransferase [Sinorhizobium meliloti]MDW9823491.1 RiPP maturation radical SAM protein 1 [Sinorhizobium meliloti]MDW9866358.1 RiPP maturation radical SAM protein 1 [Sinorhizobium meliloti]RVG63162.1 RiPP maturation radical SAM protein 1 [Sinorhizobium meliloti]
MSADVPIVLVNMPMSAIQRPSLALGLLKSVLTRAGLRSKTMYANISFLEYAGLANYDLLERSPSPLAEWLFAGIAFPDRKADDDAFLERYLKGDPRHPDKGMAERANILELRSLIGGFIDWISNKILEQRPAIVGCTSTFAQHVPSLALLRRLSERSPGLVTLMGGANCESVMGRTTHASFPWVDYVVSGEADALIGPLCRNILNHGKDIPPANLPFGVFGPTHRKTGYPVTSTGDLVPRAVVENMHDLPLPDFSDYFAELDRSLYADRVYPGLPLEFSRGCWWGQRSHCKFCGLNGGSMTYRQKPAEQAAEEMIEMSARYGLSRIEAVDNILATDYIEKALPRLTALPDKLAIFFEVKANLKRHEVDKLAAGGVRWIQPGIESLDTRPLKLMGKGTTSAQNVQLLKWCRQYGVWVIWSILWGFPGESDAWYAEMAQLLPLLHHLQPPVGVVPLRYHRFSPYHRAAEQHGLKLRPAAAYRYVYPLSEPDLANLVYSFEDSEDSDVAAYSAALDANRRPGLDAVVKGVEAWKEARLNPTEPMLSMRDSGDETIVEDTRPIAVEREHRVKGLAREILLAADEGTPEARLRGRLSTANVMQSEIDGVIADMIARKLIVRLDARLVGLALWNPHTPMPPPTAFPGGYFDKGP